MRRKDREMDVDFAMGVLERCEFATLAMTLPDGKPYCIPISPALVDGAVVFHCAQHGCKTDVMRVNPSVCLSAACDVSAVPEDFTTEYASAVAFGTATEVIDDAGKVEALRAICERYAASNMKGFDEAIERSLHRTAVWRIDMGELTGKRKKAAKGERDE